MDAESSMGAAPETSHLYTILGFQEGGSKASHKVAMERQGGCYMAVSKKLRALFWQSLLQGSLCLGLSWGPNLVYLGAPIYGNPHMGPHFQNATLLEL